ncbi:hypothetical protein HMPREF9137_1912 [Prevotella denticola F0289]|nr:hypothetical protein HMPREF9137_1912 [Prevotella denticola F0289]
MVSYAFNVSAPAPYLSEGRCGDGLCLDSAAKIIISSEYRPDPSVFLKRGGVFTGVPDLHPANPGLPSNV